MADSGEKRDSKGEDVAAKKETLAPTEAGGDVPRASKTPEGAAPEEPRASQLAPKDGDAARASTAEPGKEDAVRGSKMIPAEEEAARASVAESARASSASRKSDGQTATPARGSDGGRTSTARASFGMPKPGEGKRPSAEAGAKGIPLLKAFGAPAAAGPSGEGPGEVQQEKRKSQETTPARTSMSEKRTSLSTKGKGPIAIADKKAEKLAEKVKDFFSQDEKKGDTHSRKPLRRPKKIYDNTYRLTPHIAYGRDRAQMILEYTLDEMMKGVTYSSETSNDLAAKIAEKIRMRILGMKFDRYKIIVMTNIGPLNRQGIHIGFRGLLDVEKDTYNYAEARGINAFCSAVIYAIYFE